MSPDLEQKDFGQMSWRERFQVVRAISLFFAITVMVFTRRRLGFRMMNPNWLLVMMCIMLTLVALFHDVAGQNASLLAVYAVAMFAMGIYQRWRRWQELCAGVRWHTMSHGISWLERLPWPPFIQSHYRLTRFIEPIILLILGILIAFVSHALSIWIIWSGIFVYIFEEDWYQKGLAQNLDTLDGLINAEVQEETVKHFQQPQPEQRQRSLEDTAGIPTGIAPDIEKQVALRKTKRRPAPDNLATVQPRP